MTHFSDIGLDMLENGEDVLTMLYSGKGKMGCCEKNGVRYLVARFDDCIEFWLDTDENDNVESFEIHYAGDGKITVNYIEWLDEDDSIFKLLNCEVHTNIDCEIPMNIMIPDAAMTDCLEDGDVLTVQAACFAESLEVVLPEEDESDDTDDGSMIPCGTFDIDGDPDFEQSPHIIMQGTVRFAEKRVNSYSGESYYYIRLECLGMVYDVLAAIDALEDTPAEGTVLDGVFWVSGRLLTRMPAEPADEA